MCYTKQNLDKDEYEVNLPAALFLQKKVAPFHIAPSRVILL